MSIYKRGSRIRILLDQFTDAEWEAIYPFDNVKCEANIEKEPDLLEYAFSVTANVADRTITLSANSDDEWPEGDYKLDARFDRGGEFIYVPSQDYIKFKIIRPVTDDEVQP